MKTLRLLLFVFVAVISSDVASQSVYITKKGKKFHKKSCKYLRSSMRELTLDRAIELKYDPCSVCKPNTNNEKKTNSSKSNLYNNGGNIKTVTKTSKSKQCSGKTKSGSRCKRKTTNSNGRCYQHQN